MYSTISTASLKGLFKHNQIFFLMSEITNFSASKIVKKIALRELSCVEVAKSMILQSQVWQELNALINFDEDKFLSDASHADKVLNSGSNIGPLHGLPLIVKDNIDTKGFITSAASRSMQNYTPNSQGQVIQN